MRCFNCGYHFKNKKDIFRDKNNYPLCKDCLYEYLGDEEHWDIDYIDEIIEDITNNFNRNYKNFHNDFHEKMELCEGCEITYYPKDSMTEINGMKYCETCVENRENEKR